MSTGASQTKQNRLAKSMRLGGIRLLAILVGFHLVVLCCMIWSAVELTSRGLKHVDIEAYPSTSNRCQDMRAYNETLQPAKPVWIPGYPGSGNDLVRTIVKKLTGLEGRDIYLDVHCGLRTNTATCKTHWPVFRRHPPATLKENFSNHAILLIRNPSRSLPSHFNYEYEFMNNLTDHSQQAPEASWIQWRDANFRKQIRLWKKVVTWWMDSPDYHIQTVIQYERLVEETTGPGLTQRVAKQLIEAGFSVANDTSCHWHWCVKRKATVKRAQHKYRPGFTEQQRSIMLRTIQELHKVYRSHPELSKALTEYEKDIENSSGLDQISRPAQ